MPWDLDHSFGQFEKVGSQEQRENLSIHKPWQGEAVFLNRVFKVEQFKRLYLARMKEFSETIFNPERIHRQVDEIAAAIRPAVQEESEEKLARFDKVVAGEAVGPAGFGGGFGGRRPEGERTPASRPGAREEGPRFGGGFPGLELRVRAMGTAVRAARRFRSACQTHQRLRHRSREIGEGSAHRQGRRDEHRRLRFGGPWPRWTRGTRRAGWARWAGRLWTRDVPWTHLCRRVRRGQEWRGHAGGVHRGIPALVQLLEHG